MKLNFSLDVTRVHNVEFFFPASCSFNRATKANKSLTKRSVFSAFLCSCARILLEYCFKRKFEFISRDVVCYKQKQIVQKFLRRLLVLHILEGQFKTRKKKIYV